MKILAALWSHDTTKLLSTERDAIDRFKRLTEAVEASVRKLESLREVKNQISPIRSIFVAPEYYFTGQRESATAARAMGDTEKDFLVETFKELSALPSLKTTLLIPGTVAWKKPFVRDIKLDEDGLPVSVHAGKTGRREKAAASLIADAKVLEATPAFQGHAYNHLMKSGHQTKVDNVPSFKEKLEGVLSKKYDYMERNTAYALLNGKVRFKYNKRGDFHEAIGDAKTVFIPGAKAGVVDIENIVFGFEICFDHNWGYLKAVPSAEIPNVHIVASARVQNDPKHMHVAEGGYFLHACSREAWTVVYQKRNDVLSELKPTLSSDFIAGSELRYWVLDLDV